MFQINLTENAKTAYKTAEDALENILDGEATYKNYRSYVLNLHSALELLFKKMLYDKNEFMIFSFDGRKYSNMIGKYKSAKKECQTLSEYIDKTDKGLPHTVTFTDAYERLAYLFNNEEFDDDFIRKLKKLNDLRNEITHYELDIKDDYLEMLNEIFIKCTEIYCKEVEGKYKLNDIIKEKIFDKCTSIFSIMLNDPLNKSIFHCIKERVGYIEGLGEDYYITFAKEIISSGYLSGGEEERKIVGRLKMFENFGLLEERSQAISEHADVDYVYLSDKYNELIDTIKDI